MFLGQKEKNRPSPSKTFFFILLTSDALVKYFEGFGQVLKCIVPYDVNKSMFNDKCYALITFKDSESVEKVLNTDRNPLKEP